MVPDLTVSHPRQQSVLTSIASASLIGLEFR
jgi:hypothetical protein